MATTTMAYDAPIYPGYDADAVVASSGQYFQGRRSDARAMACYGSELETPGSRQSVQFDDNGRLYLFLSIGHHVTAAERKQLRWTVFARPDIEGLIEDVSFKVLSESAVILEAITPAPAWLQQKPHRQEHDIPLGQGKSHQMDDVMVVLHDPRFALNWGPHEAPPGQYLRQEAPTQAAAMQAQPARASSSPWGLPDAPARTMAATSAWGTEYSQMRRVGAGQAPPKHTDFDEFPPLNGVRPTSFVIGRTHSFSSALQAAGAPPVRHCATEGSRGFGSGYTVLSARSAADVPAALTPSSRVSSTGSVASSSGRSSGRNARASMGAAGRASANAGVNAASSSSDASANGVKRASEKLPPDHGGAPVQGTRSEPNIHAMLRATLEDGIHACQNAADERGTMAGSSRADAGSSCRLNFHGTVGVRGRQEAQGSQGDFGIGAKGGRRRRRGRGRGASTVGPHVEAPSRSEVARAPGSGAVTGTAATAAGTTGTAWTATATAARTAMDAATAVGGATAASSVGVETSGEGCVREGGSSGTRTPLSARDASTCSAESEESGAGRLSNGHTQRQRQTDAGGAPDGRGAGASGRQQGQNGGGSHINGGFAGAGKGAEGAVAGMQTQTCSSGRTCAAVGAGGEPFQGDNTGADAGAVAGAGASASGAYGGRAEGTRAAADREKLIALSQSAVDGVLRWLREMNLGEYCDAFQQQAVDGRLLSTLTEEDLREHLKISSSLDRRRLVLQLDDLRKAVPPPPLAPIRNASAPERAYSLEEVKEPLELKQLRDRVENSASALTVVDGDMCFVERIRVVKVCRVHNEHLSYMLQRTSEQLLKPRQGRAVPPQGGYFHGTSEAATLSICKEGFDNALWKGGNYGRGQYLSASASKAVSGKYTHGDCMLLLCEAVLGNAWQIESDAAPPPQLDGRGWGGLTLDSLREQGYDSLAVVESDEIVVYRRYQAIPHYVIYFERYREDVGSSADRFTPPMQLGGANAAVAYFADGRYEQWLSRDGPGSVELGKGSCTRCRARDRRQRSTEVFLKLVYDKERAANEIAALKDVGAAHAPALVDSFELAGGRGTVLVLEAAQQGEDSCLSSMCRRNVRIDDVDRVNQHTKLGLVQDVLSLLGRVHQAGWVHCDVKPQHFMRFSGVGGSTLKLVDFGSAQRVGVTATPAHTRRYCPPELAARIAERRSHEPIVMRPQFDSWAAGLLVYELLAGRPFFGESVEYWDIATSADTALQARLKELPEGTISDPQARLLKCMIRLQPDLRSTAHDLSEKKVFSSADDTFDRKKLEVAAFFCDPRRDLGLMREIELLLSVFVDNRRKQVIPAATLSSVANVFDRGFLPRVISFSGHQFCGHLLFEKEGPGSSSHGALPTADDLISLLCPQRAPELQIVFLNACKTEALSHEVHRALPHLSFVCWRTLALNAAAKVFSLGFYEALARGERVPVDTAFEAGRARLLRAGYKEGDPEDHLHHPDHPHPKTDFRRCPDGAWRKCWGCNPPVHGQPVLVIRGKSHPEYVAFTPTAV